MWFKVTPTFGSAYRASTCNENTDFDTKILVFEGSDCNSLSCVAHNDDLEDCGTKSGVSWPAETGKEYYILVHGYWAVNKRGSFGLSIEEFAMPENDECEFATLVTPSESVIISGSTSNAMVDKSTPSCFLPVVSPGVWYKVSGTGGSLVASTCNSETAYDTRIAIFEGDDCGNLRALMPTVMTDRVPLVPI